MPTPRTRRREPSQVGPLAIVALAAAAALVVVGAGGGKSTSAATRPQAADAEAWSGFVGEQRAQIPMDQRQLVVLRAPSLADRVARAGGLATEVDERRWTREAFAKQRELISRLALQGIVVRPEFTYGRVLDGFSAALDPRAATLLERMPEVQGVYPVRAAYPATVSTQRIAAATGSGGLTRLAVPGMTGRGVTIALLDTGVDRVHPLLRGHVRRGFDVVSRDGAAIAEARPGAPTDVERHGTELAGLIAARPSAAGPHGLAPGVTVIPLRVAGWQRDAAGDWTIYGRTDQIIAGLERAVDPNGDGDAHDAARIALLGVVEPFAAFASSPSAQAVAGALALDTLVVCPAGNDGPAGPTYGMIAGPGGSPAALTVGAADLRRATANVRVVLRAGLNVLLDRRLPLVGADGPSGVLTLRVAAPRAATGARARRPAPPKPADFFGRDGQSLVAGAAAVLSGASSPGIAVEHAAAAGAHAVLLYGGTVPSGALGLDEDVDVPVVGIPRDAALAAAAAARAGADVEVSIGTPRLRHADVGGRIADFSSWGLAFDGGIKPDVAAPAVGLATTEPGTHADGSPRVGTVNGSSAAAAGVAATAALLAQARPALDAAALRSVLVGSARPLAGESELAQGAGLIDGGAAAAAELALEPGSVSFGPLTPGDDAVRPIRVRNVSSRALTLRVRMTGSGPAQFTARPARLRIGAGKDATVRLGVRVWKGSSGDVLASGVVVAAPEAGVPVRLPWSLVVRRRPPSLLADVRLSKTTFRPSDSAPAVLFFQAGRVQAAGQRLQVDPVDRLDVELWSAGGKKMGVLARLRNLLPGRYAFGLTGRGPAGNLLRKARYHLRLVATPPGGGPPSRRALTFRVEKGGGKRGG